MKELIEAEINFYDLKNFLLQRMFMISLTYSLPNAPFLYPLKHQKTLRFTSVFRGQRRSALGTNELNTGSVTIEMIEYNEICLSKLTQSYDLNLI